MVSNQSAAFPLVVPFKSLIRMLICRSSHTPKWSVSKTWRPATPNASSLRRRFDEALCGVKTAVSCSTRYENGAALAKDMGVSLAQLEHHQSDITSPTSVVQLQLRGCKTMRSIPNYHTSSPTQSHLSQSLSFLPPPLPSVLNETTSSISRGRDRLKSIVTIIGDEQQDDLFDPLRFRLERPRQLPVQEWHNSRYSRWLRCWFIRLSIPSRTPSRPTSTS